MSYTHWSGTHWHHLVACAIRGFGCLSVPFVGAKSTMATSVCIRTGHTVGILPGHLTLADKGYFRDRWLVVSTSLVPKHFGGWVAPLKPFYSK